MPLYKITGKIETVIFAESKLEADILSQEFLLREVNDGGGIDVTYVDKITHPDDAKRFLNCFPWNLDEFVTVKEYLQLEKK